MANYTTTGSDTFPAGHVVRTTKIYDNSPNSHTSTTAVNGQVASGIILSTPAVGSGNYNRINLQCSAQFSPTTNRIFLYASKNGAAYAELGNQRYNYTEGNVHQYAVYGEIDVVGLEDGTNLYQLYFDLAATGTFYMIHGGYPYDFTCMEIKG